MRMTEENLEEASEGNRKDWFEKGGCPESRQVERQSASNRKKNRVNSAISAQRTTPDKN